MTDSLLMVAGQRITLKAFGTPGRYTSTEIYPQPSNDKLLNFIVRVQLSFLFSKLILSRKGSTI